MASIGTASLTIVPKFNGLGNAVNSALGGVDTTSSGVKMGSGLAAGIEKGTGGLVKSGAIMGIFSAVTTKAMDLVASSVDGAVSRLDTLNNYPRVMQALGYSAEESQASITKMADHLTGLPTALNDMTSTVQGIAAVANDLTLATDAGLALNDMLLASGSSTQLTTAAMEQFRQMLAKGKPEMQDWKSLTSAMPGQMNQLAQAMLGPTANANDLYAALGGGGGEATITMDQLMRKMVELDTVGGEGITSFAEQAKNATDGIAAGASNMQTAIERGLTYIMESVGRDTISGTIKGIGSGFESALKLVGDGITEVKPLVSDIVGTIQSIGPAAVPAIAGLAGLAAGSKGLSVLATAVTSLHSPMALFKGIATGASESMLTLASSMKSGSKASEGLLKVAGTLGGTMGGPLVAGIGAGVVATGLIVAAWLEAREDAEEFETATTGLTDAISASAAPIQTVSGAYDSLTGAAGSTSMSLGEVTAKVDAAIESQAKLAASIQERNDSMAGDVALLETYQQTIGDYANQTGLTAQQQQELRFAIEQVNEQCGTQYSVVDAANGVIADQNGVIQGNTDAIFENIDARQQQMKVEVLEENWKDTYKQQLTDQEALTEATRTLANAEAERQAAYDAGLDGLAAYDQAVKDAESNVSRARDALDATTDALGSCTDQITAATSGADVLALAMTEMGGTVAEKVSAMGTDINALSTELMNAGVSADELSRISQDDFAAMLDGCGGDITKLTGMIELYNATPVIDKDGNVNVEAATLADAQGQLYTWNGTAFVDKSGTAAVDGTSLVDAQGRLYTWNGSSLYDQWGNAIVNDGVPLAQQNLDGYNASNLENKSADATVSGNMEYANGQKAEWNASGLADWVGEGVINITKTISEFFTGSQNAAGGIRLNAEGGYRFHAGGAIATKAVPLDIVGEDGAEAIVPLTNKRYSEPFARTIAEQMALVPSNTDAARIVEAINVLHSDLLAIYGVIPGGMTQREFARQVRRAYA